LLDAERYHKGWALHQKAWLRMERSLHEKQRKAFAEVFRAPGAPSNEKSEQKAPDLIQLTAPYLSQNDSGSRQGRRMCIYFICAVAAS
jgi:hypothetical protein